MLREAETSEPRLVGARSGLEVWMLGRAMLVLPTIPEKASPELREAIARRRVAALRGACPCGARRRLVQRHGRMAVVVEHDRACSASDAAIAQLMPVTGSTTYTSRLREPALAALLEGALGEMKNAVPVPMCSHVASEKAAFACAQHPLLGLACRSCLERHISGHDVHAERTCDLCGCEVDDISGVAGDAVLMASTRSPDGREALFAGPVWFVGLGVCRPCRAGGERAESEAS